MYNWVEIATVSEDLQGYPTEKQQDGNLTDVGLKLGATFFNIWTKIHYKISASCNSSSLTETEIIELHLDFKKSSSWQEGKDTSTKC